VKIPNLWQAKPKGDFEQLLKPLFYVYFTSLAQPLLNVEHTAREFRKMHIAPAVAATPVASGLLVEMA
jgi:hypothetical protein